MKRKRQNSIARKFAKLKPITAGYIHLGHPIRHFKHCLLALMFSFSIAGTATAGSPGDAIFAKRAETAFNDAQARYRSQMDNPVAAWQFARACYDWADWATNKAQRASIAKEGIAACHQSLRFTNSAAGHYYLAMDMGQLAQSESLGALKLVREMEREFQSAADLDSGADFGGAERGLGLLYRDAPGWPLSIGNRAKARKYLESAAAIAPDYPENILNLAEGYSKWGDTADEKKELAGLDALWPAARKKLTGPAWESSWEDWTKRRDALRQKLRQ
ncbi:MAG TPA: hypothetical protein VGY98_13415 [Verrucomicrobiae bacterium]|nr:hypothetical protein [Verrucomicrobiae bacterium]